MTLRERISLVLLGLVLVCGGLGTLQAHAQMGGVGGGMNLATASSLFVKKDGSNLPITSASSKTLFAGTSSASVTIAPGDGGGNVTIGCQTASCQHVEVLTSIGEFRVYDGADLVLAIDGDDTAGDNVVWDIPSAASGYSWQVKHAGTMAVGVDAATGRLDIGSGALYSSTNSYLSVLEDSILGNGGRWTLSTQSGFTATASSAVAQLGQNQDAMVSARVYGSADAAAEVAVWLGTKYTDAATSDAAVLLAVGHDVEHGGSASAEFQVLADGTVQANAFSGLGGSFIFGADAFCLTQGGCDIGAVDSEVGTVFPQALDVNSPAVSSGNILEVGEAFVGNYLEVTHAGVVNIGSAAELKLDAAGDLDLAPAGDLDFQGGGYVMFGSQGAGAPTGTDCDADAERTRMYLDTTNHRLYVCNGATRGWDYLALTD